jgi:hypothetical protein
MRDLQKSIYDRREGEGDAGQMSKPGGRNVLKVTRALGVKVLDASLHSPTSVRPKRCFCMPTLQKVVRHGEAHLTMVLRLIVETKGNATELWAATITAISELLLAMPWLAERGLDLFDAFDRIDMAALRRRAKAIKRANGQEVWAIMFNLLCDHFYSDEQGEMFEEGWRRAA